MTLAITALFLIGYLATAYYYRIAYRQISLRLSRLENKQKRLVNTTFDTAYDHAEHLSQLSASANLLRRDLGNLKEQVKRYSQTSFANIGELQARLRHVECILGEKEGRKKARKERANDQQKEKPRPDAPSDEDPS